MSHLRPLNCELADIAKNKLNEVQSRIPDDLQAFRVWIAARQPQLRARTDDQFLIAFLRYAKYSLESAKKRIEYFYTYKSTAKELLRSRRIDETILDISQSNIFHTLPNPLQPGGPSIHVTVMGNINPSLHSVTDTFRYHFMRCEIEINTDDNWNIAGVIEILDFSKFPFAFLRQFDLGLFKKMAAVLEHGIPTNLKGTHIVNASKEVQIILGLIRNVMNHKELLFIHPNLESLQQTVGKEYLPLEYGGLNSSLKDAAENYKQLLISFKPYFDEDEKYGVDEKCYQGRNVCDLFNGSTVGSFRKLDID